MNKLLKKQQIGLELFVYDDQQDAILPDLCRDLRVYGACHDDWPVVYVFIEDSHKAA